MNSANRWILRWVIVSSGIACAAGLLFADPLHRFVAALVGAVAPLALYCAAQMLHFAAVKARQRNWLQYNVRGLLILVVACSVALAVYDRWLRIYHEQWRLIAAVNRCGGSGSMTRNGVMIGMVGMSDDVLASLATMPGRLKVTQIHVRGSITDAGIIHLTRFPELSDVILVNCPVTDQGVKQLGTIPKLRGVSLDGCPNITDESVKWLATRRDLRMINLMNTQVTPVKIEELAKALPYCDVARNRP